MKLSDCFVMEAFNELINFPFEDVRAAFKQFDCYVAMGKEESFVKEVVHIKNWYSEELKKIEKYTQEEYTDLVNSGEDIPEYDEPSFMIKEVEIQVKSKMIEIISKYFDRDVFEQNKTFFFRNEVFQEKSVETPHELWVVLNVHKDHIYSILSILGYYQMLFSPERDRASARNYCFGRKATLLSPNLLPQNRYKRKLFS